MKPDDIILRRGLILASASPRRRALLADAGWQCEVIPAEVAEIAPAHLTVGETTLWNAKAKAMEVARRVRAARAGALVLGADTLVALDGEALGKPRDMEEAYAMLARLSGRTHQVCSGVWLMDAAARQTRGFVEISRVRFRKLRAEEIREALELSDPLDKAGAYAAQHDPLGIIAEITGSRTNVIGLPMETLRAELLAFS